MTAKVGVIGTGMMGRGMAISLQRAGFDVIGYDVSEQSRDAARERGIAVCETLRDAVAEADFILSSLPNPPIARAVWTGTEGILRFARQGAVGLEMSSIDPATMKDIAEAGRSAGVAVLDTPVSGGPAESENGTLVLMIGGEQDDIDRAMSALKALGQTHLFTGEAGTAKIVKLVNNVMTMGNVLVASEAFAMGTAAGVDPQRLFDALSQSGGRSHHFLKRFPKAIDKNFEPGFTMQLGEKDVALAVEFARSIGRPMPAASLVREIMTMAMGMGYRQKDIVALLDMYQKIGAENPDDAGRK